MTSSKSRKKSASRKSMSNSEYSKLTSVSFSASCSNSLNSRKSTSSSPESTSCYILSSMSSLTSFGGFTINILSIIAGVILFIITLEVGVLSSEDTIVAAYA